MILERNDAPRSYRDDEDDDDDDDDDDDLLPYAITVCPSSRAGCM